MPQLIFQPTVIAAAGTKPKRIEEFVGRVNTGTPSLSIARMSSPRGWVEPGQRPEFDEYTVVLHGRLRVESEDHSTLDCAPVKESWSEPGNGSAIPRPNPKGQSISPSACLRSLPTRCIATRRCGSCQDFLSLRETASTSPNTRRKLPPQILAICASS